MLWKKAKKPSGDPEIIIETTLIDSGSNSASGKAVVVTITDNAGGMPQSIQARIFESQFTTKAAGKGTGLGLSIAYQIVTDTHQGNIECFSELGKGTTFRVTLPIE